MDQQMERADRTTRTTWLLVAAVGFLGGWVVHDELSTPAAALASDDPPAAVAPPTPVVVALAVPGTSGSTGDPAASTALDPAVLASSTDPGAPAQDPSAPHTAATQRGAQQPATPQRTAQQRVAPPTDAPPRTAARTAAEPSPAETGPVNGSHPTTVTSWNVVVASDGSVVLVGSGGRLVANTGAASQGATVALESDASTIETGDVAAGLPARAPAATGTSARLAAPLPAQLPAGTQPGTAPAPRGPLSTTAAPGLGGLTSWQQVADYEDHSVHVVGHGQIVTNDDSNAFIDRVGQVNSNTGDTDSSAINALDVTDSRIRSGSSAGIPDEPGEDELGQDDAPAEQTPPPAQAPLPAQPPTVTAPAVTTPAVTTPAEQPDADAAGAEIHDKSVHSTGTGNAVTQDDSSLVLGGTGHVNAQAGDSDTAGVVAMGVHGSELQSGCAGTSCGLPDTP
jgi:hypothetical protein